jgi:hypothetical protein
MRKWDGGHVVPAGSERGAVDVGWWALGSGRLEVNVGQRYGLCRWLRHLQ